MKIYIFIIVYVFSMSFLSSEELHAKNKIWKILDASQPSWTIEYALYHSGMIVCYECALPSIGYPAMNGNLFQVKVGKWELDGETIKVYFTGGEWESWRKADESNGGPNRYFLNDTSFFVRDKLKFHEKLKELMAGNYLTGGTVEDKWPAFEKKFVPTKTAHDKLMDGDGSHR